MSNREQYRVVPVAFMLLSVLAVALLGCDTQASKTASGPRQTPYIFAIHYPLPVGPSGKIATLDPNLAIDPASRTVVSLLFDGLVTLDQRMQVEPWGAKSIDISPDGLTYTFHLRPGQAFADGTPITAFDYAFSINRALNPCLASSAAAPLTVIKGAATFASETCVNGQIGVNTAAGQTSPLITTLLADALQTPDNSTLVIVLAHPAAYFLAALAAPVADALNPDLVGSDITSERWTDRLDYGARGTGASGMFFLAKWDTLGGNIILLRNAHWWGEGQGKRLLLTEVDFTLFKSADDAYAAYQAGVFHMAFTPTSQVAQVKTNPDFHAIGTLTYTGLSINWTRAPFNNLDARQAFCLAVNRDALNTEAFSSTVIPHWNIVPQGMPGFNPTITGPDGVTSTTGDDAVAARHWAAYLTTSGASPSTPIPYLYDASDPTAKLVAQTLAAQWEQALGVQIILRGESHAAWQRDVDTGNYVLAPVSAPVNYPDPQDILSRLFRSTSDVQLPDVPAADILMAQADASGDAATRLQEYQRAEQLLVTNVVTCPLFQSQAFYEVRDVCVQNWSIAPNGLTPLDAWVATFLDYTSIKPYCNVSR